MDCHVDWVGRIAWWILLQNPQKFRRKIARSRRQAAWFFSQMLHEIFSYIYWLVVGPPLWKIWVRQLGWYDIPNICKNKIHGNQTTNQTNIAMIAMDMLWFIHRWFTYEKPCDIWWYLATFKNHPKKITQQKYVGPCSSTFSVRKKRWTFGATGQPHESRMLGPPMARSLNCSRWGKASSGTTG